MAHDQHISSLAELFKIKRAMQECQQDSDEKDNIMLSHVQDACIELSRKIVICVNGTYPMIIPYNATQQEFPGMDESMILHQTSSPLEQDSHKAANVPNAAQQEFPGLDGSMNLHRTSSPEHGSHKAVAILNNVAQQEMPGLDAPMDSQQASATSEQQTGGSTGWMPDIQQATLDVLEDEIVEASEIYPYVKAPLDTNFNTVCPFSLNHMKCRLASGGNCSLRTAYLRNDANWDQSEETLKSYGIMLRYGNCLKHDIGRCQFGHDHVEERKVMRDRKVQKFHADFNM